MQTLELLEENLKRVTNYSKGEVTTHILRYCIQDNSKSRTLYEIIIDAESKSIKLEQYNKEDKDIEIEFHIFKEIQDILDSLEKPKVITIEKPVYYPMYYPNYNYPYVDPFKVTNIMYTNNTKEK